jgi:hypothetical protein
MLSAEGLRYAAFCAFAVPVLIAYVWVRRLEICGQANLLRHSRSLLSADWDRQSMDLVALIRVLLSLFDAVCMFSQAIL